MGTADPKLDGRLDGVYTAATLPAATTVPAGTKAFTSDRGPVTSDGTNWLAHFGNFLTGTDPRVQTNTPLTGFTITVADTANQLILTPAGTLAAGTINLPANPYDGMEVAIASTQTVTALTLSGNGKTLNAAVTTIGATSPVRYKYNAAATTWYRIA